MSRRLLVIEGDDRTPFFLAVEAGTMTLGGNPQNAEAILRDLRISRIHCEIEVDEDAVVVSNNTAEKAGSPSTYELHPGEALEIGRSRLRLEAAPEDAPAPTLTLPDSDELPGLQEEASDEQGAAPDAALAEQALKKRLVVIDGADQGHIFVLPEAGITTVGHSAKHADVILHDLYVARIHCEIRIEGESVVVVHVQGQKGTLINGQPISRQELRIGDVLRVGNSHMRLEVVSAEQIAKEQAEAAKATEESDYEVVEAVEDDEEAVELVEAADEDDQTHALPHAAVDELLKLEGETLGHFRIEKLLGRGQSGVVFRSVDGRNNHPVALKILSPDFPKTEPELVRFAKALKVVPQLHHAHLLTVFGAGKTGAYCWIAREHVEGESVARLMQRLREEDKLDWTRACRVALHLGKVLYFLHGHKVTHGNLTPRNILVRSADKATKLADLMLNQALEGSGLQKAILGRKMLAELPYLPPEQSDPHDPVTPAGDIYALGGVLYGLLTGQPPFDADTPREVRALAREGKLVRPSKLRKGIPAPFEAAVLKMLGRRPEDRFKTATELLAEVETIAYEHGVTA
jgi:hypothetical protein